MQRGDAIYKELCLTCHGNDGRGTPQPGTVNNITVAPSLERAPRVQGHRDYVIKTLLHAGIITARTAPLYAVWVDMDELKAEGEGIPGDVVAEEMLVVLREINARRKRIAAKDVTAIAS